MFAATHKREYANANVYYGLMLLAQAGITGIFVPPMLWCFTFSGSWH